jgi:acetyl esterase/lipase
MSGLRAAGRIGLAVVVAATAIGVSARSAAPAVAAPSCPTVGGVLLVKDTIKSTTTDGNPVVVCNGKVPTFDGTPLNLDVTLPTVPYVPLGSTTPATPPLVMLLSGWSNDICQFESTSLAGTAPTGCPDYIGNPGYHWNNDWFASNGLVALTYTPRGWYESCGKDASGINNGGTPYSYTTDAACAGTGRASWTHLYDRRWEIHDAQYLAGLLVDAGLVDPNKIVSTGDSGGGGPSWDLALSQDNIVQTSCTDVTLASCYTPWVSPGAQHTPIHFAAAIPMFTWTDLVAALLDNGLSSDGFNGAPAYGNTQSPIGVDKQSDVSGLYALGVSNPGRTPPPDGAQYAAPLADPTADLQTWFPLINAGEPYGANVQAVGALIGGPLHSPFAIPFPAANEEKPVFAIQGTTDTLFSGLQAVAMVNRLKAHDPAYPVYQFLGDVGHALAQNPIEVWKQAHDQSNAWLNQELAGQPVTQPITTIVTTKCIAGQSFVSYTGTDLASIATQVVNFSSAAAQSINSDATLNAYEGTQTDPVANSGCRKLSAATAVQNDPNEAVYTFALPANTSATLVGSPVVQVTAAVTGTSAELNGRLWDVGPDGMQTLITRNAYRIEQAVGATAPINANFELWPNAWQLGCGHQLKLELTQDDVPTWRADNVTSSMTLTNLQLTLPTVPNAGCSFAAALAESPLVPAIPLVAVAAVGSVALWRRRRGTS